MKEETNMNKTLANMNKAELVALISALQAQGVKAPRPKSLTGENKFRICNPEKTQVVGTPLRGLDDALAKGKTFATWLDSVEGESVKRRAYDGGSWLLVDSRGLTDEQAKAVVDKWATGKKLTRKTVTGATGGADGKPAKAVELWLFAKAGK